MGKMNIYQMLKHCTLCEEMYLGKTKHKRTLLGRLFGKMALNSLSKMIHRLEQIRQQVRILR